MKYELRRFGEVVQYTTAIAPYVSGAVVMFQCSSVDSVAKKKIQ